MGTKAHYPKFDQPTLKALFVTGDLTKAAVLPEPMVGNLWYLELTSKAWGVRPMESQKVGRRTFKTIDAACKTAKAIGFVNVAVSFCR